MTTPGGQCAACGAAVARTRCEKCGAATSAGGFRVLSVLAQTPHSRTYVAEDAAGRKVALKELLFAAVPTAQQLEAFEREGRLLRQLEHPRIPRFLDSFQEGEGAGTRLYLAQELVEGKSLWQHLREATFDEAQARDVAAQVLDVLAYLHVRLPPVIHRDVKPHNLIARPDGSIALVDFGAARELASGVTHQATLVGTYGYMPPDQLAGTVDPTSDLYALGATLMHLLTGRPPEKLVGEDLELGAAMSLNASPGFERFVRKLAARTAARRFPTADAAMTALNALPPVKVRGAKRGMLPWVAAAAAVALVAAAAGVVWKMRGAGPAQAAKVWAWEPKVPVFEAANPRSELSGQAISAGTELEVEHAPDGRAEFLRLLPPRSGFVRASDVRAVAPRYEAVLESARVALGEAVLASAEAEGERAHAIRPREREPLALLLALFNAQQRPDDARRASESLKALGGLPPAAAPAQTDERVGPGPRPGDSWFIGASMLRVRKKASTDAAVIAELGINSEVEVVAVHGDWAEVKWMRPAIGQDLNLDEPDAPAAEASEEVKGFVAQTYLVRERIDKAWTLAKATAAEQRGDAAEMERQLARASAIDPVDRPLRLRLAKAAVALRDYPVAASAAVAANELLRGLAEPLVELDLAYRCRGDRSRAEWIDDDSSVEHMPEDACIKSLTPAECEPCDCGDGDMEEYERLERSRQLLQACMAEGAAAGKEEDERQVECQGQVEEQLQNETQPDPLAEYRAQESKREEKKSAIDGAFPEQSWLRVKVIGPMHTAPDANRVVVYALDVQETQEPGCAGVEGVECECVEATAAVQAIDAMAVPPPGKDATVWVRVPRFEDATYGVAFGKSARAVAARLEAEHSACGAGAPARSIHVSLSARGCSECQCT